MDTGPISIQVESLSGVETRTISIGSLAGARFSSRDTATMRQELDEMLSQDGQYSGATKTNPSIFRIARYLLTQEETFEVQGFLTGGEAEVVAIRCDDELFISVGSDQCDRELDPLFPDKPKQMCPHPMATVAWPYAEVQDHWDQLQIYSEVTVGPHAIPLQDSPLSTLVNLDYLLAMHSVQTLANPMFLYCGSAEPLATAAQQAQALSLPESIIHGTGDAFLARLHDPVLNRTIEHKFQAIPVGDDFAERCGRPVSN